MSMVLAIVFFCVTSFLIVYLGLDPWRYRYRNPLFVVFLLVTLAGAVLGNFLLPPLLDVLERLFPVNILASIMGGIALLVVLRRLLEQRKY
jgi:hypothetical protein